MVVLINELKGFSFISQEKTRQSIFFSFYHLPFAHFGI